MSPHLAMVWVVLKDDLHGECGCASNIDDVGELFGWTAYFPVTDDIPCPIRPLHDTSRYSRKQMPWFRGGFGFCLLAPCSRILLAERGDDIPRLRTRRPLSLPFGSLRRCQLRSNGNGTAGFSSSESPRVFEHGNGVHRRCGSYRIQSLHILFVL